METVNVGGEFEALTLEYEILGNVVHTRETSGPVSILLFRTKRVEN